MPAAPQRGGRGGDVDTALRAHVGRPPVLADLLEHDGDLGLGGGAQDVDDALDLLLPAAVDVLALDQGVHEPEPARLPGLEASGGQDGREHREPGERVGVEQRARHGLGVDARDEQAGGHRVGVRRGGPEVAGVGDQARVQAACGRQVDGRAHGVEQVQHHDSGGLGPRVDVVEGAEAGVGHVVVDHQGRARRVGAAGQRAETVDAAGVEDDEQLGGRHDLAGGDHEPGHVEVAQRLGGTLGRAERHLDLGPAPVQREPEGQRAAERVGVRVDVGEQYHLVGGGEHAHRLLETDGPARVVDRHHGRWIPLRVPARRVPAQPVGRDGSSSPTGTSSRSSSSSPSSRGLRYGSASPA